MPRIRQHNRANWMPCCQPKHKMSQPPKRGPAIIGTRRTMLCTPTPIVLLTLF